GTAHGRPAREARGEDRRDHQGRSRGRPLTAVPGDAELVLRVPDALLELPAVGRRVSGLQLLELGAGVVELLLRARIVDVVGLHRVVDKGDRAILEHLEETGAGCELLDLAVAE